MGNQLDFYAGTLSEGSTLRYTTLLINQTEVPTGTYLAMQDYNQDLGGFTIGYKFNFYQRDMNAFTSGDRLYSNGYGTVHYEPENKNNSS
jgi:hypothetical protein